MILVDKEIKKLGTSVIVEGYDESSVGPVSYDVTVDTIITESNNVTSYKLAPGEAVFVKTKEKIKVPTDILVRVGEKTSQMRMLLSVSGPHYFPGHETYMYLRVHNISMNTIEIAEGVKIAQIFFEQLSDTPDVTYDRQQGASYNNENQYRGLGNYKDEYERRVSRINDARDKLEDSVNNIYVNIMTIMGVFVSIFSLIMVNFSQFDTGNASNPKYLVTVNISLGIIIALFMGMILVFLNKAKNKKFLAAYVIIMIVLLLILAAVLLI
jgi:hypothetical protein